MNSEVCLGSVPPVRRSAAPRKSGGHDGCRPIMFAYWGTRGALCEFSRSFAHVMAAQSDIRCTFSISSSNELLPEYSFLNGDLFAIDTFRQKLHAFTHLGG